GTLWGGATFLAGAQQRQICRRARWRAGGPWGGPRTKGAVGAAGRGATRSSGGQASGASVTQPGALRGGWGWGGGASARVSAGSQQPRSQGAARRCASGGGSARGASPWQQACGSSAGGAWAA